MGDATRTLAKRFALYPNHSRIEMKFLSLGFDVLPRIIWQKTTNAPNKFMGSGMLPAGAYVTLEHEYILVFRKKGRRSFDTAFQKSRRQASSIFWEERNAWYSDLWKESGVRQAMDNYAEKNLRKRSAAFPLEIPLRLVSMYSLIGDTVLDPFLGTGTTMTGCVALARNSMGMEIDKEFCRQAQDRLASSLPLLGDCVQARLVRHADFCANHIDSNSAKGYTNKWHGFKVKTQQERYLVVPQLLEIKSKDGRLTCAMHEMPAGSMKGWE